MIRKTAPIERSISPRTMTKTTPPPRIAYGAKYGSAALKFAPVAKSGVVAAKYTIVAIVTTMMLPSRSVRKPRPSFSTLAPRARPRRPDPWMELAPAPCCQTRPPRLGLDDPSRRAAALVAAFRLLYGATVSLRQELQAGVDVGDAGEFVPRPGRGRARGSAGSPVGRAAGRS